MEQRHARAGAAVRAAAAAAVIAVAIATPVGGGWGAVTAPPVYAPFVEFHADGGIARPAHNPATPDPLVAQGRRPSSRAPFTTPTPRPP